jgi:type III secretory pathway component EscV|tara:strand:- start:1645 stop:2268 length:624 start_codon:yes stop_codon:yes gene_type:complete
MKGKKSFIMYADYIHTFNILNDEKAGRLIKTIFSYVNDENPQIDEEVLQVAFEPIKQQLKRDLKGWENKKSKRVEAGRLGGLAKANNAKQSKANLTVNDSVNVNVTVNDSVNKINNHIINDFNTVFNGIKKARVFPNKLQKKYKELIKEGFTLKMVLSAMQNAKQDQFHKDTNFRYCTLEYFSRVKTLDKYCYISENKKDNKYIPTL